MLTAYDLQKLQNKVTWGNQDVQKTLADLRWEISTMFIASLAVNAFFSTSGDLGGDSEMMCKFCPFCGRENLMLITTSAPIGKSEDWRCDACGTFFTISDVESGQNKPAGILVRYTGISGEAEFICSILIPYAGDVPAEKAVRDYFSDFFSEGTKREDYFLYVSQDGCRAVKIDGWTTVPEADARVLQKYMSF